jgi:diguanylate cyclase (GGDEF)-like protein
MVERTADELTDLMEIRPVARAAGLAVEALQQVVGGGPWCVVDRGRGEVLAVTGPMDHTVARIVPWPVPDLELLVVAGDVEPELASPTVEHIGRLVAAVVDAEAHAAQAQARAERAHLLASTDRLTGLIAQGEWWSRIAELEARLARNPQPVAIAVVDLDELKLTNDTQGHLHGDLLIRLAAKTLDTAVRAGDVVARVGGDEFAVLLFDPEAPAEELAAGLAERLEHADIPASVGVCTHAAGRTLRQTYAVADQSMYAAKRRRRSRRRGAQQGR